MTDFQEIQDSFQGIEISPEIETFQEVELPPEIEDLTIDRMVQSVSYVTSPITLPMSVDLNSHRTESSLDLSIITLSRIPQEVGE